MRHGWGSYPGLTAPIGSPREYGEWKLVYVPDVQPKTVAKDVRSPTGKAAPGVAEEARKVAGEELVLSAAAQAEAVLHSPTPTILGGTIARGLHKSVLQTEIEKAWGKATTPEIVAALNSYHSTGNCLTPAPSCRDRSASVPLTTRGVPDEGGLKLPWISPTGRRVLGEWDAGSKSVDRARQLKDLKEGPEARLMYRGGALRMPLAGPSPSKTHLVDTQSPVVLTRDPSVSLLHVVAGLTVLMSFLDVG